MTKPVMGGIIRLFVFIADIVLNIADIVIEIISFLYYTICVALSKGKEDMD